MHRTFTKGSMTIALLVVLLVLAALGLAACGSDSTETTAAPSPTAGVATTVAAATTTTAAPTTTTLGEPQPLTVSAASSLKAAFTDLGAAFDAANNAKTVFNFDASGTLQKQIEAGATVDIFAAAAMKQVNALVEGGFADQTSVTVFASNEILLAVPAASTLGLTSFEDLTKPEVKKVAYGDPASAPHGVYAEEAMTTLGIFDQVKPKVIYTKNASQTLTYVTGGEVDAGIMFATDAIAGGSDVKVVATCDPGWHSEIVYPAAVVSSSTNKELAQEFIDFLMNDEGQAILQGYGFVAPPVAGGAMEVKGLVDNPMTLALADLQAMNVATITAEHPKKGAQEYTGVLLSEIITKVGVQSGATVLDMGASDGYMGEVTLAELDPNSMIALGEDGTLNAVMPGQSGKAWVNDIITLEFK